MKKTILALLLTLITAILMSGCNGDKFAIREINDYFYEAGTYSSLDYEFANNYFKTEYDNWGGGCSAISKVIDGNRLVGRNMDLNISNKCAYFVRTKVPDKYETIGLAYTFRDISPDYETVKKEGIGETFQKILPFMCDDVINSEGLHIEINMRHGEKDEQGNDLFGVEHTNPSCSERIYVFNLCQYLALNCRNLTEVKEYLANSIDVYSMKDYWNYCFVITDAVGNCNLLEFGNNKYYWVEPDENGIVAQANFYVNEECSKLETIKTGLGRYDTLMENIGNVTSKKELFDLMKKVQYSSFYLPYEECMNNHFDPRSEVIGEAEGVTYDFVMDPENQEFVNEYFNYSSEEYQSLSRKERQDINSYWESTFTEIVNPRDKIIEVRLFENESCYYQISFDGVKSIDAI